MFTNSKKRFKLRSAKALPARRRHELGESDLAPEFLDRLTPEQRAWWLKFLAEDTAGAVKKGDRGAIYRTDEGRRDAYQRNNRANRDLLNLANVTGTLASLDAPVSGDGDGGPALAEVTSGQVLTEAELLELADALPDEPDGASDGAPTFGGEAVYRWAEALAVRPGLLRSQPTPVLRASLAGFCRLRGWAYPFGADDNNNLLGRALKSLGLRSFRQGIRAQSHSRRWERVYGLSAGAHPTLLDSRFWVPEAFRPAPPAAPDPRLLLKPGPRPRTELHPAHEESMKPTRDKKLEPLPPTPDAPPHEECLPVVKSLGLVQQGSRQIVVYLETQGDKVVHRQVVSACPEVPGLAAATFRHAAVRRLGVL